MEIDHLQRTGEISFQVQNNLLNIFNRVSKSG